MVYTGLAQSRWAKWPPPGLEWFRPTFYDTLLIIAAFFKDGNAETWPNYVSTKPCQWILSTAISLWSLPIFLLRIRFLFKSFFKKPYVKRPKPSETHSTASSLEEFAIYLVLWVQCASALAQTNSRLLHGFIPGWTGSKSESSAGTNEGSRADEARYTDSSLCQHCLHAFAVSAHGVYFQHCLNFYPNYLYRMSRVDTKDRPKTLE